MPINVTSNTVVDTFENNVVQGRVAGHSEIQLFGYNNIITTTSDPEDLWTQGGLYTFTDNDGTSYYVSSSSISDTQELVFTVLTADGLGNWNLEIFNQTIAGQTKTLLTPPSGNPIVRINRVLNNSNSNNIGDIYVYEDDTVTAGVPQTASKVRAKIMAGDNVTTQNIYTVPTGFVAFVYKVETGMNFSGSPGAGTNFARFDYRFRPFDKTFILAKEQSCINLGSSNFTERRTFPDPLPAKTDFKITCREVSNTLGVWATTDLLLIEESYLTQAFKQRIGQIGRVTE